MIRLAILFLISGFLGACRSETLQTQEVERTILREGVEVESVHYEGVWWQVITIDSGKSGLSIRHTGDSGTPLRDFSAFHEQADALDQATVWMMNAGMYHADGSPVGLCVSDGQEVRPVNRSGGPGNFFLKPNGIFYLSDQGAGVIDTKEWPLASGVSVRCATQSGPLLVRRGALHPSIRANSPNKLIRNGVGVRADGQVCFVISTAPVSFHGMATFLRDHLLCPDALYLDGSVSALCVPRLGINSDAKGLGPVIGLWE